MRLVDAVNKIVQECFDSSGVNTSAAHYRDRVEKAFADAEATRCMRCLERDFVMKGSVCPACGVDALGCP